MKKHSSNKTEQRSRRDFLASGIVGIAGSTLLAEQMTRGTTLTGGPLGVMNQSPLPAESSAQGVPAAARFDVCR